MKEKEDIQEENSLDEIGTRHFFPSNELNFLQQRGLDPSDELLEIERDRPFGEIKEDIILLFHPHIQNLLRIYDFRLGRVEKSKKIAILGDIQGGTDLENQLMQSKIIILSLNNFLDNLPVIEEPDLSFLQTSRNGSTQSLIHTYQRDSDSDSIGLEQISSNSLPSISRFPGTNRLSRRSRRIQFQIVDNDEEEEEFHENEGDQLGIRAETIANKCLIFPSLLEDAEANTIHTCRSNCLHDLMNFYIDERVVNKNLCVTFLGEMDIDGGGLTKELFTKIPVTIIFNWSNNISELDFAKNRCV